VSARWRKLTRYIERNMPDDKPGTCVGRKAEAVAGYIYNAFLLARKRAESSRRGSSWARLTNRQLPETASPISLRSFTGGERDADGERGFARGVLRFEKFQTTTRKQSSGVDRAVDFRLWRGPTGPEAGQYERIFRAMARVVASG